MGTVCLSPAPGLRCVGLSLIQEAITIIPTAVEVVFSLGLMFGGYNAGRTRYILAAESPTYLLLAVLSLLDRAVPLFQTSLLAHKILDIATGAASFIPILLFTCYLYLFKRKEFFPRLPKRFTLIANSFAVVVIPVIVVTNEIGSFLGIKYRKVPDPVNRIVGNQVAVGPDMSSFQFGREFLRSTSLALLTMYQLITFFIFFVRLVSCIMAQRNIEDRAATERESVMFRGMGWLAVGMKISAVETGVGFVSTSFGIILTRRILRMLGRACIIIGVIKGPDLQEEFFMLDADKGGEFLSGTRKLRMSGMRVNISSPQFVRSSMSQRISRMTSLRPSLVTRASPIPGSPNTTEFERILSASRYSSGIPLDQPTHLSVPAEKPRPTPLILPRSSSESHVSVVRGHGRAPTLVLNLSPMDLPSNDILAAMNSNRSSTSTINHLRAFPMPPVTPELRSAPFSWLTRGRSGFPPGFSDDERSRRTESLRTRSSRGRSVPTGVPPVPFIARVPAAGLRESYAWPSREPERAESPIESWQVSGRPVRPSTEHFHLPQRSGKASDNTDGAIPLDWIAPPENDGRVGRFKTFGSVPRRTTPTPTSADPVRGSVMLEHHESLEGGRRARTLSQWEMETVRNRKDSGVLGADDLVRVRRGSPSTF
ncbi:hypothetical protein BC826DRAFT_568721 [Russula brevipes]|nr:hypothetical protein BC826DRAFT_568721 [Russula brevipes]